jgi:hypothetical protein
MNHSIKPGLLPASRGLEKEEPEQGYEDDIPSDDASEPSSNPRGSDGAADGDSKE